MKAKRWLGILLAAGILFSMAARAMGAEITDRFDGALFPVLQNMKVMTGPPHSAVQEDGYYQLQNREMKIGSITYPNKGYTQVTVTACTTRSSFASRQGNELIRGYSDVNTGSPVYRLRYSPMEDILCAESGGQTYLCTIQNYHYVFLPFSCASGSFPYYGVDIYASRDGEYFYPLDTAFSVTQRDGCYLEEVSAQIPSDVRAVRILSSCAVSLASVDGSPVSNRAEKALGISRIRFLAPQESSSSGTDSSSSSSSSEESSSSQEESSSTSSSSSEVSSSEPSASSSEGMEEPEKTGTLGQYVAPREEDSPKNTDRGSDRYYGDTAGVLLREETPEVSFLPGSFGGAAGGGYSVNQGKGTARPAGEAIRPDAGDTASKKEGEEERSPAKPIDSMPGVLEEKTGIREVSEIPQAEKRSTGYAYVALYLGGILLFFATLVWTTLRKGRG